MNDLLKLAKEEFEALSPAEDLFIRSTENGELTDFRTRVDEEDNPANSDEWGTERTIKADLIIWLCTNMKALNLVSRKGIHVLGARIDGIVDLAFINISFPLQFINCSFSELILLNHSEIALLNLIGTHTAQIEALGLKVSGDINLSNGFSANSQVSFMKATISGHLNCDGGKVDGDNNIALIAEGISIGGSAFLRKGFSAKGEVKFSGASISGNFELDGAHITNISGSTLNAENIKISGSLYLRDGFKSEGEVRLHNASIGGSLDCEGGKFENDSRIALGADSISIGGGVFLRKGFSAKGEVRFIAANINGNFELDGAHITNINGSTLNADNVKVLGSIFLRDGFNSEGEIRLPNASIGATLDCDGGRFINKRGNSIFADSIEVIGNIYFRSRFFSEGTIKIIGANIGGNFECDGAKLTNDRNPAMQADRIKVGGDIFLRNGFDAEGKIIMTGARITGNLEFDDAKFKNDGNDALILDSIKVGGNVFFRKSFYHSGGIILSGANINGQLAWSQIRNKSKGVLDLRSATIKSLFIDFNCLPAKGSLYLRNLTYDEIFESEMINTKQLIDLLHRQISDFIPQPYEQMASVLRKYGKEDAAKQILIQKNIDQYTSSDFNLFNFFKFYLLLFFIGFGYRPWRPLWISFIFILLGTSIFNFGYEQYIIGPSQDNENNSINFRIPHEVPDNYFEFYSFVYSLDNFIPLIDLKQSDFWFPSAKKGKIILRVNGVNLYSGGLVLLYFYIHILFGWVLTSLFIVGLTGIIRQ